MAVMYNDAKEVLENGFFQGYDGVVILIVLIQVKIKVLLYIVRAIYNSLVPGILNTR